MISPKTVLFAIGVGGKIQTATVYGETVEEFAAALQRAAWEQADRQGQPREGVYVWEPGSENTIDLRRLKRL
jgi:hypothetical protein